MRQSHRFLSWCGVAGVRHGQLRAPGPPCGVRTTSRGGSPLPPPPLLPQGVSWRLVLLPARLHTARGLRQVRGPGRAPRAAWERAALRTVAVGVPLRSHPSCTQRRSDSVNRTHTDGPKVSACPWATPTASSRLSPSRRGLGAVGGQPLCSVPDHQPHQWDAL